MTLSLEFLGAAGTVTGSRTLLRYENKSYLVDCGLFQGSHELRQRNWEAFKPDPKTIDAVVLTHAHIDHTGYLPRLYNQGFRGEIHSSLGTAALCQVMLLDAAKIQEEDAEFANRTQYSNHKPALPLYTVKDAEEVLKLFKAHPRNEWIGLSKNLSFQFVRSGHIVGSSFIQFSANTASGQKFLTFSGDVGHGRSKSLKGPLPILESDILVLEATYGNRLHLKEDPLKSLAAALSRAIARKGVVIIPSFAVGRAQELLYCIRLLEDQGQIPAIPVILDSPMAQKATEIFLQRTEDNQIESSFLGKDENFFPKHFEASVSADDSMLACMRAGPMIVISASGMLSGGRVLHHLKHRISQAENMVLFVGYQAEGSKGRFLQNIRHTGGDFRVHHVNIPVEAEIVSLDHFSAHADFQEIMDWVAGFQKKPSKVLINHSSPESSSAMATHLKERFGINAIPLSKEQKFRFDF